MKSYILWDIMPCNLLKVNLLFGGIAHLNIQGRRIGKERNQHEASRKQHVVIFDDLYKSNAVFWDVAQCRSCVNRRFGGTCRLHLQGRKIRVRGTSGSR
jgi:hypothetical protein